MTIPLSIVIYERGAAGVPSTAQVTPAPGAPISYQHTIAAAGGFESATIPYVTTRATALDWLANGLMRSVVVTGPDGETVWEGFIEQIDATLGQEARSVSLRDMGNRVRVKYTTVLGTPGTTSSLSDTASQAIYGIKDRVESVGTTTAAGAAQLAARVLRETKNPPSAPTSSVKTGAIGDVSLQIHCAGWGTTLGWLVTTNASTTTTATTTQIQTLTTAANAVNAFLSTDYSGIVASGISDTETIAPDTTYLEKMRALLDQGTSAGERLAWGIYEARAWLIAPWAGATPDTITYRRVLGDGTIYDTYGLRVAPWRVRPDAMYQVVDLLDPAPVSTAQDSASRFYVERVTCSIDADGIGVDLEPAQSNAIDARIARIAAYRSVL